jgi:hypothetical protein
MESPSILPGIALRTAWYTLAAGWVLGAAYSVLLFLVALVLGYMNDFKDTPFLGRSGLPKIFNIFDLSSLDELGVAGAIGAAIVVAISGAIVGAVVGAVVGGISGAIAGLATGALAVSAFFPITYSNVRQFRMAITVTGIVVTAVAAIILGPAVFQMLIAGNAGGDLTASWLIQALLPGLLAGVGAWWAGRHVAEWYEDEYLDSSTAAG